MIIAGFDVATRTGLAIFDGERFVHAEAFRPKGKTNGEINSGFRNWVIANFGAFHVEHAAAEEPLVTNLKDKDGKPIVTMSTYRRIYGLFGVLEEVCATRNTPLETVHQGTWRKAFLRNGRADKDAAVAQCQLMRWSVVSKDSAEACGVAWWLSGHLRLGSGALPGDLFRTESAA